MRFKMFMDEILSTWQTNCSTISARVCKKKLELSAAETSPAARRTQPRAVKCAVRGWSQRRGAEARRTQRVLSVGGALPPKAAISYLRAKRAVRGATAPRQGNCRGRASRGCAVPDATLKRASCGVCPVARPLAAPVRLENRLRRIGKSLEVYHTND